MGLLTIRLFGGGEYRKNSRRESIVWANGCEFEALPIQMFHTSSLITFGTSSMYSNHPRKLVGFCFPTTYYAVRSFMWSFSTRTLARTERTEPPHVVRNIWLAQKTIVISQSIRIDSVVAQRVGFDILSLSYNIMFLGFL